MAPNGGTSDRGVLFAYVSRSGFALTCKVRPGVSFLDKFQLDIDTASGDFLYALGVSASAI